MEENSVPNNIQRWIKPIVIIVIVFILGFSIPVLIKNYLAQKAGIISTPTKQSSIEHEKKLKEPYYSFEPETLSLKRGEKKLIKVIINTKLKRIEAFDLAVNYDPKIVSVAAVEATPLFPAYPAIEYGNGKITIGGNIGLNNESFAVNDTLAVITLEGKTPGKTILQLNKEQSTIASKGVNILRDANSVKIIVKQ